MPVDTNDRDLRQYRATKLPTLREDRNFIGSRDDDLRETLYKEICTTWHTLTDVRFKLLGFIPTLSGVGLFALLTANIDPTKAKLPPILQSGLAVFGLLIIFGLWIYDRRNSQLYDDLISRARKIEEELGIDTGLFRGRLISYEKFIKHDIATNIIYGTVIIAWLAAVIVVWLPLDPPKCS